MEFYQKFMPAGCSCLEDIIPPSAKSRKIQAGVEQNKHKTTLRGRIHITITADSFTYIINARDRNIYSAYTFYYSSTLKSIEFVQN